MTIRPLTKRSQQGIAYTRLPEVQSALETAAVQELDTLRRRALVDNPKVPDYLQSECFVYLIREARRTNDGRTTNALLPLFLRRCERLLCAGVPTTVAHAADLREEILGQLAVLFAQDGTGHNPDELDFYEIRFNSAFRTLRIDVLRTQLPRGENEVSFAELGETDLSFDDRSMARLSPDLLDPNTHEHALALRDVLRGLPVHYQQAVVLCDVMGYEVESQDPTKTTAATICGVTGRTIRNRLREARRLLSIRKDVL